MSHLGLDRSRHASRRSAVAATLGGLAAGLVLSVSCVAAAAATAVGASCPAAFPVSALKVGQAASGLTVSAGETPQPFAVKITGVLHDGIAPGVDMIVASTDSAAIRAAGGVWAGMSGSPVYAGDGRLIGAISYGLAGASEVAGITPAAAMYEDLSLAAVATAAALQRPGGAMLPAALRKAVVASGAATGAQASGGLRALPTPLGVSGLAASRLAAFTADLQRKGLTNTILYSSAARTAGTAPAAKVVPGGNFAGLLASGDATMGGVGTTTAICRGKALAFGHPFTEGGSVSDSANLASVLYVQRDDLFGPFKVANIGATVGTLDQDRLAAIRATLGSTPRSTAVSSVVRSSTTGASRSGATSIYDDRFVSDATGVHLLSNLDRVAQKIGEGSTSVAWDIRGRTAAGRAFTLARSDQYAALDDATFASVFEVMDQLDAIESNPFTDLTIDTIRLTATTSEQYRAYRVTGLQVREHGAFVPVAAGDTITAAAKSALQIRVMLTPYRGRGTAKTLTMSLTVPNAVGSEATLFAGAQAQQGGDDSGDPPAPAQPTSFDALVASLANAPRNTAVLGSLAVSDASSPTATTVDQVTQVDQVVDGSISATVDIVH